MFGWLGLKINPQTQTETDGDEKEVKKVREQRYGEAILHFRYVEL
jgi:hypothetical protein